MEDKLDNAPCGYLSFDDEGHILEVNGTLLRLLRFNIEELRSRHLQAILSVASRIFYQTHLFPLLALHGRADEIFITLQTKDKTNLPMLAYAVRRNHITECILVTVEQRARYEDEILSAKRTAEEALRNNDELQNAKSLLEKQTEELDRRIRKSEQMNRELLQVTDILFHDLREPIRKIETFTDLISNEASLPPDSRMVLSKIESACHRMSKLLRALQEFVSVEPIQEPPEPVDLNLMVDRCYAAAQQSHSSQAHFERDKLPVIEGYPKQLQLMFAHLFDNAFKFTKPNSELRISIEASLVQENRFDATPGRYSYLDFVQIFFRDNGMGISDPYRKPVFELLKKLDPNNPRAGSGLAVCRKVAENHFGRIQVEPHGESGAIFRILLPLKQI